MFLTVHKKKVSTLQAYLPVLTTIPFSGLGLVTQKSRGYEPKSLGRSRKPCWRAQPPSRLLTAPVGAAASARRCRPAGFVFYKLCQESWQRKLNRAGLLPWAEAAWPDFRLGSSRYRGATAGRSQFPGKAGCLVAKLHNLISKKGQLLGLRTWN